jgi:hypothetical protein
MLGYPFFEGFLMVVGLMSVVRWGASRADYAIVGLAIILLNNVLLPFLIQDRFNSGWLFVHRVYGIPANLVFATFLAVGTWRGTPKPTPLFWGGIALVGATVIGLACMTYPYGYRRHDRIADQVGRDVLDSLPQRATLLPNDDFLYCLLYLTQVEKYRPDVSILRDDFGFDKEKGFSAIYSIVPSSPALEKELAGMGRIRLVPEGLAYRIERVTAATPPIDPKTFKELASPPEIPPPAVDPHDIFHRFARGLVSNYYAEVGRKRLAENKPAEAEKAFDQAEQCADTALACLRLEEIYRQGKIRGDQRVRLLKSALRYHDHYYDPASSRYLYLDREAITARLSQAEASSP